MTKYFSQTHEWALGPVVGITDWAQKELGEIVYIDLPEVGSEVQAGDVLCVVETTKAATDIYAPFSGKIESVNEQLHEKPYLLNQDPENSGWIARVAFEKAGEYEKELKALIDEPAYRELTQLSPKDAPN